MLDRKHNLYEDARKLYKDISMKNLDWPEAIWEAWISFENTFGSVQEIDECLDRVERAQTQVNKRRAKVLPQLRKIVVCSDALNVGANSGDGCTIKLQHELQG